MGIGGKRKFWNYLSDKWNLCGAVVFWSYFLALVLQMARYKFANIAMALSATFAVLMLLKQLLAFSKIGIYIIMISAMVRVCQIASPC